MNRIKEKEKKMEKPISVRFKESTKQAIDKICQKEDRSLSYIIERAVRAGLNLDEEK
jgi:predicted transcriptional regulator